MDRLYPHLKTSKKLLHMMEAQKNQSITRTLRQEIIVKYLDSESGLLDKMLGCRLLTWEEFDDIRATGSQRSKNEKLLNVVLGRDTCMYQQFLNLLKETQHSHLMDYESDSDYYRRLVRGDIPLTRREETILDLNREVIVEVITNTTQLAEKLSFQHVLNDKQLHRISSTTSNIQRSDMFFDTIRKRSLKDFETTIRCLRTMRQGYLANILEGGGRICCRLKSDTTPEDEETIVSGFLTEISDQQSEKDISESDLRLLKLGLTYVRRSNGLVLYFHHRSLTELQALKKEVNSGSLRQKVEDDFDDLMFPRDRVQLETLEWTDHDYKRCQLYFTLVPSTTMNDLPLEVFDMILERTIQLLKLFGEKVTDATHCNKFISLASVSDFWSQRIRKSFSRKAVQRNYHAMVQKDKKTTTILRSNREYLMDEIHPNELIHHLVQSRCIDEKQVSLLRRLPNDKDKNSELLKVARRFSSKEHSRFVECLYQTNQLNAARIVERGGVTVKMCIKSEAIPNGDALEKDMVGKLQRVLHDNLDEKLWPHTLFNSVTRSIYDIVILSAKQVRGVVELWLWCESQEALDRLKATDESELIKITEQLFSKFQSSRHTSLNPQNAYIDSSYFEHDLVFRSMSAKLSGSVRVQSDRTPTEVTYLRDKFFITIASKVIIHEAEAPYKRLEKTIKLPGIRMIDSVEVVACTVNEYLYINDPDTDAIWKVNPANDYELTKWLSNLDDVKKVSTSSRGEVFVLDTNHSCPTVSVYTQDAVLQRIVPIRFRSAAYSIRSAAVEIMPDVVAVSFVFADGNTIREGLIVARLNGTGQVLREVEWKGLSSILPYSMGRFIATEGSSGKHTLLDYQLYPVHVVFIKSQDNSGSYCYRRDKRELIVGHSVSANDYQLDIYMLRYN